MQTSISLYHRHRFPAEIISLCVWLYFRFALSFRDVEEMLTMRGVTVSYETIREGASSSARPMPMTCDEDLLGLATSGTWLKRSSRSTARTHYLFRAVDRDGDVLDIMVQCKRDKTAAKKFFRKLLKGRCQLNSAEAK